MTEQEMIRELNKENEMSGSPMRLCRHGQHYDLRTDNVGFLYHKCLLCSDDWYCSCDEYDHVQAFLDSEGP